MFEDTKRVIPEAVNRRRTYNQIDKRQEDKQMTYKTLHRKLKIEQHVPWCRLLVEIKNKVYQFMAGMSIKHTQM